jgi:phage terminase large subunit GpA-like protein
MYPTLAALIREMSSGLKPPERLSVSEAAEKYRFLNNPGAYIGPWKNETTPYLTEVMDVLDSRDHKGCILAAPAQTGKTDLIINWLSHTVICSPADFILYQTSQTVARDFSRRRVDRLHRHSPEVGKQLLMRGDADNVFDKHYRSGMMFTLSWPTINEMSGRPVGKVALTDYDRMPENIDGEGSPYALASKRTTTFGSFAMTFAESSPGYETSNPKWLQPAGSPHEAPPCPGILALYNHGDRRRWHIPCPHCNHFFEPSFKYLDWGGVSEPMEARERVVMVCPNHGCLIEPKWKADINKAGRWLREGQKISPSGVITGQGRVSNIASFWLKGPAATFISWEELVVKYLQAEEEFQKTGSQEALKSTVNTDQGEPYVPRGLGSSRLPEDLKDRANDLPEREVPANVRCLIATMDVQGNRWEVQVHGLLPGDTQGMYDVVVIDRFHIQKSERRDADGERHWVKPGTYLEDWDLVTDQVIKKTYPLADGSGRHMQIKMVACDSGGKKGVTSMAYAYWRKLKKEGLHGRFLLLKGEGSPTAPRINLTHPDSARKDRMAGARGEIPVLLLSTNKIKDQLDQMLDRTTAGGGMIRFPDWLPDHFFVELTVEQKDEKGRWINPKALRNESWDLLVYLIATASHLRVEFIDWLAPPNWVAPWDTNALVFDATVGEQRFEVRRKPKSDLKKLAADLA